ncbi:MAG TPA: hypothetical protein VGU25_05390 [Acidobacteriaceae bacterium]|nr:hypothetical protein [Acidobacteriaceae bacterium]
MNATKSKLISGTLAVAAMLVMPGLAVLPLNAAVRPASAITSCDDGSLNKLIRNAHTPEEYQLLAFHFRCEEALYRDKAAAVVVEWNRNNAVAGGPGRKFPVRTDSARDLYDYYSHKADGMAMQAASYEQRAR